MQARGRARTQGCDGAANFARANVPIKLQLAFGPIKPIWRENLAGTRTGQGQCSLPLCVDLLGHQGPLTSDPLRASTKTGDTPSNLSLAGDLVRSNLGRALVAEMTSGQKRKLQDDGQEMSTGAVPKASGKKRQKASKKTAEKRVNAQGATVRYSKASQKVRERIARALPGRALHLFKNSGHL